MKCCMYLVPSMFTAATLVRAISGILGLSTNNSNLSTKFQSNTDTRPSSKKISHILRSCEDYIQKF